MEKVFEIQITDLKEKILNSSDLKKVELLEELGFLLIQHTNSRKEGLQCFFEILEEPYAKNNPKILTKIHYKIGHFFSSKFYDLENSLKHLFKSLKLAQETNDKKIEAATSSRIGINYTELKDYDGAINYLKNAIDCFNEIGEKEKTSYPLVSLGRIYIEIGDYEKALEITKSAFELAKNINDEKQLGTCLGNLGLIYFRLKNSQKAFSNYSSSLKIYRKINFQLGIASVLDNLGDFYQNEGNLAKALQSYEEALKIAEANDFVRLKRTLYRSLAKLYKKELNFEKALSFSEKLIEVKNKIFSEELAHRIAEQKINFEFEQKEKEKEIYRLKNIELVKLNEELEKTQEMLIETERLKMFFAMVITANHELNQPLSVLMGNIELLQCTANDKLSSKEKQCLERAIEATKNCSDILVKLRNIKEPKYKKYMDNLEMVDLNF